MAIDNEPTKGGQNELGREWDVLKDDDTPEKGIDGVGFADDNQGRVVDPEKALYMAHAMNRGLDRLASLNGKLSAIQEVRELERDFAYYYEGMRRWFENSNDKLGFRLGHEPVIADKLGEITTKLRENGLSQGNFKDFQHGPSSIFANDGEEVVRSIEALDYELSENEEFFQKKFEQCPRDNEKIVGIIGYLYDNPSVAIELGALMGLYRQRQRPRDKRIDDIARLVVTDPERNERTLKEYDEIEARAREELSVNGLTLEQIQYALTALEKPLQVSYYSSRADLVLAKMKINLQNWWKLNRISPRDFSAFDVSISPEERAEIVKGRSDHMIGFWTEALSSSVEFALTADEKKRVLTQSDNLSYVEQRFWAEAYLHAYYGPSLVRCRELKAAIQGVHELWERGEI